MSEAVSVGPAILTEREITSLRRRAIVACSVGNFFELFDFAIYSYIAVAIARAFYPTSSMYGAFADRSHNPGSDVPPDLYGRDEQNRGEQR